MTRNPRRRQLEESLVVEDLSSVISNENLEHNDRVEERIRDDTDSPAELESKEDFSEEWLLSLEASGRYYDDTEYLHLVIEALSSMEQNLPPVDLPPVRISEPDSSDSEEDSIHQPATATANTFSALNYLDSDSSDSDEDESDTIDSQPRRSALVGYLLIQAYCLLADAIIKDIPDLLTDAEYTTVASKWRDAHDQLMDAHVVADPYLAVKLQAEETPNSGLEEHYDFEQLNNALDCLGVQAEHTLKELLRSVAEMEKDRANLEKRLEELEERKRQIITKKGKDWWKNHPRKTCGVTDFNIDEKAQINRALMNIADALHQINEGQLEEGLVNIVNKFVADEDDLE